MYELNLGENPWPKEMYLACDVKCQYFVSFAQDSFLATELSLGLETIINETRIQISHGSVQKKSTFQADPGSFCSRLSFKNLYYFLLYKNMRIF